MIANFKYFWYVFKHKWFVYHAGRAMGCDRAQLILHDLTKFTKDEWTPYVNRFYRGKDNKSQFYRALMHHYENNPHHWNFWLDPITDKPNDMPTYFIREMIADWMGASRVKTGSYDICGWYRANQTKIKLHPITRIVVESLIPGWDQHYNNLIKVEI